MTTALLIIDVQQGLCEGEHATFEGNEYLMPRQAIWHHNATLANSSSFGPERAPRRQRRPADRSVRA